MALHEGFLADIIAHPDDDVHRLIYADWLEDQGGEAEVARAEFIRLQVEQARRPDDPGAEERKDRARALRLRYAEVWDEGAFQGLEEFSYRRGFVERVELSADEFLDRADTLFRLTPLRELRLGGLGRQVDRLTALPQVARLRRFESSGDLEAPEVSVLVQCPYLAGLVGLDLQGNALDEEAVRALANSPHLAGLTHLSLAHTTLRPEDARALAGSPYLTNLRLLNLHFNAIGPEGAIALAQSPLFEHLTALDIGFNEIGDDGALALARSRLRGLTSLVLSHSEISEVGMIALAQKYDLWEQMRRVELQHNLFADEGVRALANAPLERLHTLNLSNNWIGSPGIEALATSPHLTSLKDLDVEGNPIGDAGALALARSPQLNAGTRLTVGPQDVQAEGRRALLERFGDRLRWYPDR